MSTSETSTDPQKNSFKTKFILVPPCKQKKRHKFPALLWHIYIALLALCLPMFSGGVTQARHFSFCLERATALSITKFYPDTTPKYIFSLDLGHFENKIWRFKELFPKKGYFLFKIPWGLGGVPKVAHPNGATRGDN